MSDKIGSAPWADFGDWHGHLGMGLAAIRSASNHVVTTLIHVGDFGLDCPGAERGRYEKKLNNLLRERGAVLVVSPGNHDHLSDVNLLDVQEDGLIVWRSNIKVLPKGGRTVISGLQFVANDLVVFGIQSCLGLVELVNSRFEDRVC